MVGVRLRSVEQRAAVAPKARVALAVLGAVHAVAERALMTLYDAHLDRHVIAGDLAPGRARLSHCEDIHSNGSVNISLFPL